MKIYLAGPDIFLADAAEIGIAKKVICESHGFDAFWPLDQDNSGAPAPLWLRIFEANRRMIGTCDAMIANLTPFRGLSADVGTAIEIGAAEGLGKPVFGYSNDFRTLEARTDADPVFGPVRDVAGRPFAADGMEAESFGVSDNLMIEGAIAASGGGLLLPPEGDIRPLGDLRLFEACVEALAASRVAPLMRQARV